MLDLHLVEEDCSILGELNLPSATNKHLDGTFWAKIGLEDFLKSFGSIDINSKGLRLSDNISIRVD